MKRILVSFAAAAAFAIPLGVVACSSSSPGNGPSDAGTGNETSATADGSMPNKDGGGMTNMDGGGGLPEGATAPQGTQIAPAMSATLEAVTDDGYAIYTDNGAQKLDVVPVAGGSPTSLGATATDVVSGGNVAIIWTGVNTNTAGATMSVWTKANGMKQVSTGALDDAQLGVGVGSGLLDVSSDSSKILFFDNSMAANKALTTGDLSVVNADGTGKTALVTGVHFDNPDCGSPQAMFVGTAIVASYCTSAGPDAGVAADAGTPAATTLAYFANGTGSPVIIASAAQPGFFADKQGTKIVYQDASGAWIWTLGMAGKGTQVPGLVQGAFTSDGTKLVFVTAAGSVETAPVATPTGTTTLASGLAGLLSLSPDDKWLLADKTSSSSSGAFLSDLYVTSATTAGTPATLDSTMNAQFFGAPFTTDSKYAVWNQNVTSAGTGDIYAAATSNGTPAKLGTGVWINASATGSKVVFNANCNGCSSSGPGTADLMSVDVSTAAMPTVLATQADGAFFLTSDKSKVVYSWNYVQGSMTGIWVAPIP